VVLFGTKTRQNSLGHKHIHILFDLDVPSVERILTLESYEQDLPCFIDKFGTSETFSIADVFWNVSSIFSNCSKKVSAKRVFLITANDDPNAGDAGKQRSSLTRANDLRDMDIAIGDYGLD
jgi:hypothetical protein